MAMDMTNAYKFSLPYGKAENYAKMVKRALKINKGMLYYIHAKQQERS